MSRDLARSLAEAISAAGIHNVFGMPGGGPNLEMIGACEDLGVKFVLTHGETAACIMASTYGQLSGNTGVAIVTRGPGLASASNGIAQATLDRSPLLLVSDTVTASDSTWVKHQRLDQVAATSPLTKWSGTLGTKDSAEVVSASLTLARGAPKGAVHLNFDPSVPGERPPRSPSSQRTLTALSQVQDLISKSTRPVIIVGLDAVDEVEEVRATLKALHCPILVTYQAKGTIPESWDSYAGLFTGSKLERPLLEEADLIIGIGLDSVEPMPNRWSYTAPVVLFGSHQLDGTYFGSPLVVAGRYDEDLPQLLGALKSTWLPDSGRQLHLQNQHRLLEDQTGFAPSDIVRITQQILGDPSVTVDAGAHMLVAMSLWEANRPRSILISNGLATMGFALPAAIAAALVEPQRQVVCFTGDGGLGMVLSELETIARLGLWITSVVFNDATLSLIQLKQRESHSGDGAVRYHPIDFAKVAQAMGVPASVVTNTEELRKALAGARRGPSLIDARVDPTSYQSVMKVARG